MQRLKTIQEALELEIVRDNCERCPKNVKGICVVTEEPIDSDERYCN